MSKLDDFTNYIPTFNLTVLAILFTLVGGGALCFVLPMYLWLSHLSIPHPGLYILPLLFVTANSINAVISDWEG